MAIGAAGAAGAVLDDAPVAVEGKAAAFVRFRISIVRWHPKQTRLAISHVQSFARVVAEPLSS